tara:strand:- start:5296 stop:6627 length:1332 start_codon:yes stop_codon:yes gene_type:complete
MPFKSEKQRRYLHANHPKIAKRWEKEYAGGGTAHLNFELNQLPEYYLQAKKGGIANHFRKKFDNGTEDPEYLGWLKTYEINPDAAAMHPNHETYLQIYNESMMEQTSSNGILDTEASEMDVTTEEVEEPINLFAQNVDDQSDAPTTLFMNSGGISQLVKQSTDGKRPGYGGPQDWGQEERGTGAYEGKAPDTSPKDDTTRTRIQDETDWEYRKQKADEMFSKTPASDEEKYDTDLEGMSDIEKYNARRNRIKAKYYDPKQRETLLTQNRNEEKARLEKKVARGIIPKIITTFFGAPLSVGFGDLGTAKAAIELAQINKDYKNDLLNEKATLMTTLDLNNPNSMNNPTLAKIDSILETLEKKEDEKKEGDDSVPPILEVPSGDDEDYYASYITDYLGKIREKQQLRASLKAKDIIQDNEIVTDDITMTLNKGGLANLFRVKNQY